MSKEYYDKICRKYSAFVRRVMKMEVIGTELVPQDNGRPLLICSNHLSMLDVVFLAANIGRHIRFLAKEEAFHMPILGRFVRNMDAIAIRRGQSDVAAIKSVLGVLGEGGTACVYPQGHRYPGVHPRTTEVRHGAGMMIWRSKCDVLPAAVIGRGWRIKPLRKNRVVFGKPIPYEELAMTAGTPEEYRRVTELVFGRISDLCDEYQLDK